MLLSLVLLNGFAFPQAAEVTARVELEHTQACQSDMISLTHQSGHEKSLLFSNVHQFPSCEMVNPRTDPSSVILELTVGSGFWYVVSKPTKPSGPLGL